MELNLKTASVWTAAHILALYCPAGRRRARTAFSWRGSSGELRASAPAYSAAHLILILFASPEGLSFHGSQYLFHRKGISYNWMQTKAKKKKVQDGFRNVPQELLLANWQNHFDLISSADETDCCSRVCFVFAASQQANNSVNSRLLPFTLPIFLQVTAHARP